MNEPPTTPRLSPRELQVLQALWDGLSNKQIAAQLAISHKTVERHRETLFARTNSHSAVAAVRWGITHGFLKP